MRKMKRGSGFLLTLLFNMLLNIQWTIPAWILLVLHYVLDWSIWWFWLALGLWFIDIFLWMTFIGWAAKCSNTPDPPKENKNPYSAKNNNFGISKND